ncbi:unnamed protein product [Nippostrongylus brasiliensis]|uniref:Probable rho GDP-dissociation inhibitor (inferred by orthology to a C. elegans protein) n=1 Tax=Nippostrongylus brasiliensis TaxID=27835 RepID=A0A0N4YCM4_NIPBR|nr:unnamed protein product [Nippostrongylus brasiliensis]
MMCGKQVTSNFYHVRPKLFEFMDKFNDQQQELEKIELENAELEKKLAELTTSTSQANEPHSGNPLESGEFEVKAMFNGLEDIYNEEEKKLAYERQTNAVLRKKLSEAQKANPGLKGSGDQVTSTESIPDHEQLDDENLAVDSLELLVDGRAPARLQLHSSDGHRERKLYVKEGVDFKLRFNFFLNKSTLSGLRYVHKVNRMHVNVSKKVFDLGSYSPSQKMQSFIVTPDRAPEGVFHRGRYVVKSQLVNKRGEQLLSFQWTMKVVKNW